MLDILIIILLFIAAILIGVATKKSEDADRKFRKIVKQYEKKVENLEQLKLQEEHKVKDLKSKNTQLSTFKEEVENIAYGKRTDEEKLDKIIEVIQSSNKNNF